MSHIKNLKFVIDIIHDGNSLGRELGRSRPAKGTRTFPGLGKVHPVDIVINDLEAIEYEQVGAVHRGLVARGNVIPAKARM